ncbi:MAG: Ig-like domain-containing protein [Bacteroidota bacterium]|nr:Ig-like domain-containing protein [Bacteroidota bacterium]
MKKKTKIVSALIIFAIMLLVHACANKAQGPTGGPKDKTPPRVMRSTPVNGSLNFKKKQVEIDFDKIVSIEKPNDNVIISPPQQKPPDVKSLGKRVVVNFNENLLDNTTYSINFGNAIADVNEKNVIKNYLFSFSTGNQIDTLKISGTVINSEDLNPMEGIIVGIYEETSSDSVFFLKPFVRIGRTDENGRFSIDNVKKGKYKVFALGDANRDYTFQPGEGLAMCDTLVAPTFRREEMKDTIWKDSTEVDSIRTYMGTRFLPDNLTLRYFKENKKRQYFVKYERKEPFVFNLYFNTSLAKLPELKPLNFNWDGKYLLQKSSKMDSLTYWITDSLVWKQDTLKMSMTYLKTDSLFQLKPVTDTIQVSMRKGRINAHAKASKKTSALKIPSLKFTNNIASTFEINNPILLNFETPLAYLDVSKIKLFQKVDTVFKEIPFKWQQLDSTKMAYAMYHKWIAETSYKVTIDSAAFTSIYKRSSTKFKSDFKIRTLDEYSSVKLFLATFNSKAMLQVVNTRDEVMATKPASEKGTVFEYLRPGDYYVRMFIDENGNGKWDTGNLAKRQQPEEVFYYPKKLTLMANWEFEETWDYTQVPLLKQKPADLIKLAAKKDKGM